jgi:hypothetical protein
MIRFVVFAIALHSFACATVLRGSKRQVTIYGPQDLQAFDGAQPVALEKEDDDDDGRVRYSTRLDRHTATLTLKSPSQQTELPLKHHLAKGFLIADLLVFWPITFIDWGTGNWNSFDDLDVSAVSLKQATFQPAPVAAPRALAAAPPPSPSPARPRGVVLEQGVVAVLDLRNFAKDLQPEDVRYFADVVRGATLRAVPGLRVMTRENLLVLLQASGKDAANCEGECEVDTGRRIGADAVISGEILKVGTHYKMSLKLHETREGRLLATTVASGKSIDDLDESAQSAVEKLFAR